MPCATYPWIAELLPVPRGSISMSLIAESDAGLTAVPLATRAMRCAISVGVLTPRTYFSLESVTTPLTACLNTLAKIFGRRRPRRSMSIPIYFKQSLSRMRFVAYSWRGVAEPPVILGSRQAADQSRSTQRAAALRCGATHLDLGHACELALSGDEPRRLLRLCIEHVRTLAGRSILALADSQVCEDVPVSSAETRNDLRRESPMSTAKRKRGGEAESGAPRWTHALAAIVGAVAFCWGVVSFFISRADQQMAAQGPAESARTHVTVSGSGSVGVGTMNGGTITTGSPAAPPAVGAASSAAAKP